MKKLHHEITKDREPGKECLHWIWDPDILEHSKNAEGGWIHWVFPGRQTVGGRIRRVAIQRRTKWPYSIRALGSFTKWESQPGLRKIATLFFSALHHCPTRWHQIWPIRDESNGQAIELAMGIVRYEMTGQVQIHHEWQIVNQKRWVVIACIYLI